MPSIYLAARYSRHPEMQVYAEQLRAIGFQITSRWILGDHDQESDYPRIAQEDFEDVCNADVIISFTEQPRCSSRGGRHCEFGVGLALGKRLILVGPHRENVFHHLAHERFDTWAECLSVLRRRAELVWQ